MSMADSPQKSAFLHRFFVSLSKSSRSAAESGCSFCARKPYRFPAPHSAACNRAHIGLEIIQILAHRFTIVPDLTHRRRRAGGCVCRRQNSSRSRKRRDLGSARRLVRCRPVHRVEHGKGSAGGSRIRGNGGTAHCRAGMADCQRGCGETAPFLASNALLYTNLIVSAIKICAI